MVNKNICRVISVFSVLAMLAMLIPTAAFANTVAINQINYDPENDLLTVTGSVSDDVDITMMAVRSHSELSEIPGGLTADDIMYVDQQEHGTYTWTFKPRATGNGSYITVFLGGGGVDQYTFDTVSIAAVAGDVGFVDNGGKDYYVNGTQVLDLSGMKAAWLEGADIKVYNGEEQVGSVDKETGILTLDSAPDEAEEYTIKFINDDEAFKPVEDKNVKVISADGAVIAEFDGVASWADNSAEADSWTINIPAGNDDVTITVTVDGVDKTGDVADGVLTVERNAEGGDPKAVVVTATAGTASKDWTFTVYAKGAGAPAITAEDVSILNSKAYGQTGKTLIAVTVGADVVNPETASMTVGDAKLYYSPDKGQYYGVVDGTLASDAAKAAENIVIDPAVASEKLYFGVILATNTGTKLNGKDFGFAGRTYLGKETPTDKQYIAMDVYSLLPDGKYTGQDFGALGRHYLGADLPVLAK